MKNKNPRNLTISRIFGTPWGIRTPGLLVRRLSQAQIRTVSAPICAFYHRSFGKFSIVSVQPCPLQSCSGSKVGQRWSCDYKDILRKYCGFISFAPSLSIRMPKISAQKMVFSELRSTKWSVLACKDMMREGNHLISTLSSLYYAFVLTEYLHFAWLCVWGTVLVIFMWQHKIWYAISKEKTEAPRIARGPGGLFTFAV